MLYLFIRMFGMRGLNIMLDKCSIDIALYRIENASYFVNEIELYLNQVIKKI